MRTQIDRRLTKQEISLVSEMLKLISDPTRLKILWSLLHGEHSVNELAAHINAQPPAVSQHLAKLRVAQLVKSRRDGNKIHYKIQNSHVRRLIEEASANASHIIQGVQDHG